MTRVVVIDYGMGNLRSVARALLHAGADQVVLSCAAREIAAADRVIFPGQGAMGSCLRHLQELELGEVVREAARNKPFLGICLGLQALFGYSEEDGGTEALGILPGRVRRFPGSTGSNGRRLKVPHMGWNQVRQEFPHPVWKNVADLAWFYFVHSYYVEAADAGQVAGTSRYGATSFASAAALENLFAVQFHPEKSHQAGLVLLANFIQWNGEFNGGGQCY